MKDEKIKEQKYFVTGMHCASCEILIEKRLLELSGVKSVEASTAKGEVLVEYEGEKPSLEKLNELFGRQNYFFSDQPSMTAGQSKSKDLFIILAIVLFLIVGFVLLGKSGLSGLVSVNAQSSLPLFFVFGLMAGISSCAALVGGMLLSLSRQWTGKKFQPHLLFNLGRLVAFAFLGAVLGMIGSKLQLSLEVSSGLVMAVSVIMFFVGLQMVGIKAMQGLQLTLPKSITGFIADEAHFRDGWLPFLAGAGTFFLPCGFTLTSQSLALLSGSLVQGSLIMLFFALGTLPTLLLIGFSSTKLFQNPAWSERFTKVAGILVIFFAFYNLNSQFNLLGLPSLNDFGTYRPKTIQQGNEKIEGLPPLVNGKQLLKMNASANGYAPNYFKVQVGVPVRWEITDIGTSGCTNAVISRGLFVGQINLTPGQVSIKEFTPQQPGKYKFSCWMGMVTGIIEIVDGDSSSGPPSAVAAQAATDGSEAVISSGVQGCGCGGGNK